jgi:RNA polymerase sigma-70 factor (ECF subfamily)
VEDRRTDGNEDVVLVNRAANGDASALAALYDRHAGAMLAVGTGILKSPRDAEDLLHDVFVEAWKRIADYDPARGSVRAWLVLRMRSRALDRVKSPARSRTKSLPDADRPADGAADRVEGSVDGARLRGALDQLPAEQREVLVLGYFQGLSSSEIAEHVGVPIGTVKSRVAAAMGKLRALLTGREVAR